jgi:DedD protein
MAEPADINVDELRRRARRRLVGAVVLALGVAVVVPMLLETEQKPLGEDVSVKIPPVDDSKFVNRLSDSRAKDAGKAAPRTGDEAATTATPGAAAPAERASKYDTRVPEAAPTPAAPTPAAPVTPAAADPAAKAASDAAKPPESASARGEAATNAPAAPAAGTSAAGAPAASARAPAAATTVKPAMPATSADAKAPAPPAAVAANAPKPAAPAHDGFAVQLAAFADDKGANALAGRLKRAGYAAYTEPLKTSKGTLWRVRVGPYGSREAAIAARDKLKAEGQSGIVAAAK